MSSSEATNTKGVMSGEQLIRQAQSVRTAVGGLRIGLPPGALPEGISNGMAALEDAAKQFMTAAQGRADLEKQDVRGGLTTRPGGQTPGNPTFNQGGQTPSDTSDDPAKFARDAINQMIAKAREMQGIALPEGNPANAESIRSSITGALDRLTKLNQQNTAPQ